MRVKRLEKAEDKVTGEMTKNELDELIINWTWILCYKALENSEVPED